MMGGRVHVLEEGKRKSKFTMHYVIFDPKKKVITGDEAKKLANAVMKISTPRLQSAYTNFGLICSTCVKSFTASSYFLK